MFEARIKPIYLEDYRKFTLALAGLTEADSVYVLPQKAGIRKDVLFLAGTHGDESVGLELMRALGDGEKHDWLIANEKAVAINKRFVDCDLNRSAPGALQSDQYEERRAAEILLKARNYNYVIDVHNHSLETRTFIILTKPSFEDLLLAAQFDINDIVVWLPSEKRPTGPLTEFIEPAVEIEANRNDGARLAAVLQKFLQEYNQPITRNNLIGKNIYWVYGKQFEKIEGWSDFAVARVDDEEFYPLMCGQYPGIGCYKMIKIIVPVDFQSVGHDAVASGRPADSRMKKVNL